LGALRASAGEVDLAPWPGLWATGFANRIQPATAIHDPIMARAALLDDGQTLLAIVSCDLLGFAPAAVHEMRQRISERSPIPQSNVLICCTHTHSGPTSMPTRLPLGDVNSKWLASVEENVVDLVAGLPAMLRPARINYGSTTVTGFGHNRQDESLPFDEELVAIGLDSADGRAIMAFANYATHAVTLGPTNLEFSGDFPGATARDLSALRGGVGLYLQGACGDVDPVVYRDRGWGTGTFDDVENMGRRLAEECVSLLRSAQGTDEAEIRVSSKTVDVPLDPPPPSERMDAWESDFRTILAKATAAGDPATEGVADAKLGWLSELRSAVAANAVPPSIPAEVFAAGINDLRLIGLPFETYSDIAVAIKRGLSPLRTAFVGYANGLYGYCPTAKAKDHGGYGPGDSHRWFRLLTGVGYGADELLVREAVELGKSL
jgi:neutral ceramidase